MKSCVAVIPFGSYPFDLLISIGQSNDARNRSLKKHFPNSKFKRGDTILSNKDAGHTAQANDGNCLIAMWEYPFTPDLKGKYAHEIYHAVEYLFEHVNIPKVKDSEAWSYQIEYLTREIYHAIDPYML